MIKLQKNFTRPAGAGHPLESTLMVLSAILSVVIVYLLYFDIPIFTQVHLKPAPDVEPIATLNVTENIVRRKTGTLPVWNFATESDALYLNDQIFTDENSWAQIEFNDKIAIDIAQNTLIVVRRMEDKNMLQLEQGMINAKITDAATIVLDIAGKQSKLTAAANTHIEIQAEKTGNAKVSVLSGSVTIDRQNKRTAILANQEATFDKNINDAGVRDTQIILSSPHSDEALAAEAGQPLTFKWQSKSKDHVLFQIANDQSFSKLVTQRSTNTTSVSIDVLNPGIYFWRVIPGVTPAHEHRNAGRRFTVVDTRPQEEIPPTPAEEKILAPPKLQKKYRIKPIRKAPERKGSWLKNWLFIVEGTAYASENDNSVIDWGLVEGAISYDAQVAKDKAFKQIVLEKNTKTPALSVSSLQAGLYYLRVRSVQKNGARSAYSDASSVYVGFTGVTLMAPQDETEVEKKSSSVMVAFEWAPLADVKTYTFELYKDPQLKSLITREKISASKTMRTFTKLQTLYWRVGVVLDEDGSSDFSEVRQLRIVDQKPKIPKPAARIVLKNSSTKICNDTAPHVLTPPYIRKQREERLGVSLGSGITKFETVSTYANSREHLTARAGTSIQADAFVWAQRSIGADVSYRYLKTTLFKKSSQENQTDEDLKWSALHVKFLYRIPLPLLAESNLDIRTGYYSSEILSIERGSDDVAVLRKRPLRGPTLGLGIERAWSSNLWILLSADYLYAMRRDQLAAMPLHVLTESKIVYAVSQYFSLGATYGLEFGKYHFSDALADDGSERYTLRKQSLGLFLGWSY